MSEKSELEMRVLTYWGANNIHFQNLIDYVEGAKPSKEKFFMLGATDNTRNYHFRSCSLVIWLDSHPSIELRLAGESDKVLNLQEDLQRVIMDANKNYNKDKEITLTGKRFK